MLESLEKEKRLTESVTHWCKYTHHINLREGDIPSLVNSILAEFYPIHLCCGHMVNEMDEGVNLEFYEYEDKSKGTIGGLYCKDCAQKYKKEPGAWEIQ